MALEARPSIYLNGQRIACTASAIEREPVAVRGLEFKWGRDSYLDGDTTPATLTCWITDATGKMALFVQNKVIIGFRIEVFYELFDTDTGNQVGSTIRMYSGRVQVATARPAGHTEDTHSQRFDVEITAADRTADYGNAVERQIKWPREKMVPRAVRIRDIGNRGGAGIDAVYFWPGYVDVYARPVEEDSLSGLDMLKAFYNSMGNDTYAYDPHANAIRQAIRFSQSMRIHLRVLDPEIESVAPAVDGFTIDSVYYPPISISAGDIKAENGAPIEASRDTSINRLESTYKSSEDNFTQNGWYVYIDNVRTGDAVRLYQWDSWIYDVNTLKATIQNVERKINFEGSRPKPPNLVMGPMNRFLSIDAAAWLLQTWENTRPAYIFGHQMNTWLDNPWTWYAPVYGPIGGVTKFDPMRGWSFDIRLQQIWEEERKDGRLEYDSVAGDIYFQWRNIYQNRGAQMTWGEAQEGAGPRFADCVSWDDMRVVHRPKNAYASHPIEPARP